MGVATEPDNRMTMPRAGLAGMIRVYRVGGRSPVLCNYYLTLRCNSRCSFCCIWRKKYPAREPTLEQIEANLRDLRRLGIAIVDFTGGEPLLYPHLIQAAAFAKSLGLRTTVTTNCLLYPRYAGKLAGLVDILQFSIHSARESEHNRVSGVDSFAKVMESIRLAKRIGQKVILAMTVANQNAAEVPGVVAFAQRNKCMLSLNPCFEYFGNAGLAKEEARRLAANFRRPFVTLDLAYVRFILQGGNRTDRPSCRAVSSAIVISPDDSLVLPCFHRETGRLEIHGRLFQLCKSREVRRARREEGRHDFCQGCTIYCCMRSSFTANPLSFRFLLSAVSGMKYLREYSRSQDGASPCGEAVRVRRPSNRALRANPVLQLAAGAPGLAARSLSPGLR